MARTLLVLGARLMQLAAIRTAKEMGLCVVAIDPEPSSIGFRFADHSYVFDLGDEANCLQVAQRHRIDGVMTLAADYPLPMVARIATDLGLPGLNLEAAARATNKRLMRTAFAAADVPSPTSLAVSDMQEAYDVTRHLCVPVIVKPAVSHGGRGVTRLAALPDRSLLEVAFKSALAETRRDGVLIEEYVDGPEFSIEAVTAGGHTQVVAVTDKLTSGDPYYVELGHNQPSLFSAKDLDTLVATARAGVEALGINDAASHTEIRLSPRGPCVMEIGARLGGGYITTHLVPLSKGVNIVRATIQTALGQSPDLRGGRSRGAAVRFLRAEPGKVQSMTGLDAAREAPGCVEAEVYVKPGDRVIPLRDARGRIGHVICEGANAETAIANAEEALRRIRVLTTP